MPTVPTTLAYAFSGTRRGMTRPQTHKLFEVLNVLQPDIIMNGCCEGSDREMHGVTVVLDAATEFFPSDDDQHEWAMGVHGVLEPVHHITPPLRRNRLMVDKGKRGLIACPHTGQELARSGTWATVRYALNIGRPVWLILPTGDLEVR